jgi:MFS transporter, FSR family, fosmidomycin resistance protein
MIILAPLFAFIQADYRLSYTELALALTAFNVVSAAVQTPRWMSGRSRRRARVLIAGPFLHPCGGACHAGLMPQQRRGRRGSWLHLELSVWARAT